MRSFKSLWIVVVALTLFSCSMSAKPEKNEKEKSSAQAEVIALNKADFLLKVYNYEKNQTQWVYEGNKPAIVDFYADWCGPCKKVSPILKELAVQYKDDIVIYKINVDDEKNWLRHSAYKVFRHCCSYPRLVNLRLLRGLCRKNSLWSR